MIEYKNNYVNLVVLGNFNPAILTHEFLTKECNLNFGVEPKTQQVSIPVVTSLEYGNVAFFADLGRLQISEKHCDDPQKSLISSYLQTYLEKLPYTPLKKSGANFSYELSVDETKLTTLHSYLKASRNRILAALRLSELDLEVHFGITGNAEQIKTWIVRTAIAESGATTMAKFYCGGADRALHVDFNFEVPGLDKNRALLDTLTVSYSQVFDTFKNQIESLLGR